MNPRNSILRFVPILMLALLVFGRFLPARFWSINHLSYLPNEWSYFAISVFFAACVILFLPTDRLTKVLNSSKGILRGNWWGILSIVLLFGGMAYLFPARTFFMGDGYQLLAHFSDNAAPPLKWTEPGSILIVGAVQSILGAQDYDSALLSFRVLSFLCGIIFIANSVLVARAISATKSIQWMTGITLLSTGAGVLFFGYVEFYPLTWAAASTVLHLSIRTLRFKLSVLWSLLVYVFALFLHLQLLALIFGQLFLLGYSIFGVKWSDHFERRRQIYLAVIAVGAVIVSAVLQQRLQFALVFLPFLSGRSGSPDYAVFSSQHILDIVNLVVLVFPGILALLAFPRRKVIDMSERATMQFLLMTAIGMSLFLLLIDPTFGIAIDWDLMSITLLPLVMLVLLTRDFGAVEDWPKKAILIGLTAATALILFGAVQATPSAGERRFTALLDYYGKKSRSGWAILTDYYERGGDSVKQKAARQAFFNAFPEDLQLWQARGAISNGNYQSATRLADSLVTIDPLRAEFHQVAAEAYGKLRNLERSSEHYGNAIVLRPYDARLRSDYGLILIEAGKYDEALAELGKAWKQDKSLFAAGEGIALAHIRKSDYSSAEKMAEQLIHVGDTPGAHLIQMVICLNQGDMEQARVHFTQYKKLGTKRSDYANILEYYGQYWPEK